MFEGAGALSAHMRAQHILMKLRPNSFNEKRTANALMQALKSFIKDLLKGNVVYTGSQFKQLQQHVEDLRSLAKTKTSIGRTKRILQKGGIREKIKLALITDRILRNSRTKERQMDKRNNKMTKNLRLIDGDLLVKLLKEGRVDRQNHPYHKI